MLITVMLYISISVSVDGDHAILSWSVKALSHDCNITMKGYKFFIRFLQAFDKELTLSIRYDFTEMLQSAVEMTSR